MQSTRALSNQSAAIILSTKQLVTSTGAVSTVNVSSTIVYTDYTNVQLRYACGQQPGSTQLYTYYFLLVRDRKVNKVQLQQVVQSINFLDALEGKVSMPIMMFNFPNCQN